MPAIGVIFSDKRSLSHEGEELFTRNRIDKDSHTMTRFKRMIAISLERIAVMLLIGTAVIFDAAQRMDPGRVDDYGNVKH